jgi:general secretion pathway protein K
MRSRSALRNEQGFALLSVILVVALLSVVVTELMSSMRLETAMVRAYRDGVIAEHLAEAGVHQAMRELSSDAQIQSLDEDGQIVFFKVAPGSAFPIRLPALPRARVSLGAGAFSYRISDEEGRLNLNTAGPLTVDRLLAVLGLEKTGRDIITDSLEDWRDADETHRANGAESEDTYLKLPVPYRARNADLQDPAELLQVKGVTPELYYGAPDRAALADLVTVRGPGTVNLNTASPLVLQALGLSEAEIQDIIQTRRSAPYTAVPPRFAGHRLHAGSSTFRIDAQGVAGEVRARVVAMVQRAPGDPGSEPTIVIQSWAQLPPLGAESR